MNVTCQDCRSVFRVDPAKVPASGVRARCSVCGALIRIASPAATPVLDTVRTATPAVVTAGASSGWGTPTDATTVTPPRGATPSVLPAFDASTPAASLPTVEVRDTSDVPTPTHTATYETPAMPPATIAMSASEGAEQPTNVTEPTTAAPTPVVAAAAIPTPPMVPALPTPVVTTATSAPDAMASLPTPVEPSTPVAMPTLPTPVFDAAAPVQAPPTPSVPLRPLVPPPPISPAQLVTPAAPAPVAAPAPATAPGAVGKRVINPFLKSDPQTRARRLARALVSDMVAYQPQKRADALANGTLKQVFRDEIRRSYDEYVDQVGRELAESTTHFQDALNEVLAEGRPLF